MHSCVFEAEVNPHGRCSSSCSPLAGVYYEPLEKGAPGEVHPEKSYTFKYPRPPK